MAINILEVSFGSTREILLGSISHVNLQRVKFPRLMEISFSAEITGRSAGGDQVCMISSPWCYLSIISMVINIKARVKIENESLAEGTRPKRQRYKEFCAQTRNVEKDSVRMSAAPSTARVDSGKIFRE